MGYSTHSLPYAAIISLYSNPQKFNKILVLSKDFIISFGPESIVHLNASARLWQKTECSLASCYEIIIYCSSRLKFHCRLSFLIFFNIT